MAEHEMKQYHREACSWAAGSDIIPDMIIPEFQQNLQVFLHFLLIFIQNIHKSDN